jgi:Arc/MetJ-type ribon-helix-helix transcriptional regulator
MVMDTVQIRLTNGIIKKVDDLIEIGLYSSRSEVVRDAVRRLVLDKMIGIIPNKKNSVKEIKNLRKKLSSEVKSFEDIEKINRLIK